MDIDLLELKFIVNRLFHHIIEIRGIHTIELKENYYWDMPEESRYNVKTHPENFDIGSLYDDWEFVSGLLETTNQPVAYQFTEIAPLLRYIGETLGRELGKFGG